MSIAERIYRVLMRFFPATHRQEFGNAMLIHTRDLNRDAQLGDRWGMSRFYASLVKDGLVNACREHWEGSRMSKNGIEPSPWLSVFMAALPGLLITLTRRMNPQLTPLVEYLYLGLLVIGVSLTWWRVKQFPVWALLPLGALAWWLIYFAGMGLARFGNSINIYLPAGMWVAIALLNIIVFTVIAVAVLRGQRLPQPAWILGIVMLAGNFILAVLYSFVENGMGEMLTGLGKYFTGAGIGVFEGLMLVAVGSIFARQHGVLAILVLVGGYSYMLADSDYLFGYLQREWAWLTAYFAALTILFLVVVPVALLRARTGLGRLLAVFVPLISFHLLRITVPLLVIQEPVQILPGEVVWTVNILLSFALAWLVYRQLGEQGIESRSGEEIALNSVVS